MGIDELHDKFFWLVLEEADMIDIDGVQYVEFQELTDLMDKFVQDMKRKEQE